MGGLTVFIFFLLVYSSRFGVASIEKQQLLGRLTMGCTVLENIGKGLSCLIRKSDLWPNIKIQRKYRAKKKTSSHQKISK